MNWKKLFLAVIMFSMLVAGKSMVSLAGEAALGVLNIAGAPCMTGPGNIVKIGNTSDFLNWYHSENRKDCDALLTSDLVIGSSLELGNTNLRKYLNTGPFTIHIASGARLVVNNSNLAFGGEREVITVENGGSLFLDQGSICNIPTNNALVIKSGGSFNQSPPPRFTVEGKIINQNRGQESDPPAADYPGGGNSDFRPILPNSDSQVPTMTCEQGKPPGKGEYPATDDVLYENEAGKHEWMKIPVVWDLSGVNFNQPGVYKIQGTYSEEALRANNLSNPNGIKAALSLVVQSKASIQIESADTLSLDKDGNAVIRIKLPLLPKEAVGLYLYYSYDQAKYTMASWTGGAGTYYNYLDGYVGGGNGATNDYIIFKIKTDGRPIWFKVQMKLGTGNTVTSVMSKPVKCNGNTDSGSHPGGGFPIRPEWNDDGSSGGNRGGGGQGTFGREEINAGSTSGGPGVSHGGPATGDDGQTGPGGMGQGGPVPSGNGQGGAVTSGNGQGGAVTNGAGASGNGQTGGSSRGGPQNGSALGGISPSAIGGTDAANQPGTEPSSAALGADQSGENGSAQGTDTQTGSNKAGNQEGTQLSKDGSAGDTGEQSEDSGSTAESIAQPGGASKRNSRTLQYGAAIVGTMGVLSLVNLGIWKYRKRRRNHSNTKKNTGR